MKKIATSICMFFILASGITAKAGSPFTKVTTVGTQGRDGAIMFAIGPDFYFGGGTGKDFWVYHSDSNTTRQLPDMPGLISERSFGTGFAIGNKGYVCLGEDEGIKTTLKNDLWQFDPATKKWTQKADFIGDARDGAFVFVIGNVAYIGGGSNDVDLYNDFFAYNAVTDKWTNKGVLPTGYTIFTAPFVINNIGYIVGGQSGQTETNGLYKYDTTSNNWTPMADFPGVARQCAIAMAIGNKAYVGLGQSQYATPYSDFYSYDPSKDQWTKINSFLGGSRAWSCAASNGTKACFAFGWDLDKTFYNDIWSFDASQVSGISPAESVIPGMDIYPDPAKDYLYLTNDNHLKINSIRINDVNGKTLKIVYPGEGEIVMRIDIGGFSKGVYFINVDSGQRLECKKFLVY